MQRREIKELLGFAVDHQWVEDNRESLIGRYNDQWIAVRNGEVIASAPELTKLLEKLPDPGHTCVEYITSEPLEMVL